MIDSATKRMARAMCAAECVDPDMMMVSGVPYMVAHGRGYAIYGEPYPVWMSYVNLAIAALTAIREPTHAMVEAGKGEIEGSLHDLCYQGEAIDITKSAWTAMVDAELKEK